MHTIEILQTNWMARFDEFSRVHEGWPVSLDITAQFLGAQSEFHQLGFVGVTAEPTDGGTIAMTVALPAGGFLTHTIHSPIHVFIEEDGAGAETALEVESADGTKATLQFRMGAAVPGLVRGRCGET